MKYILLTQSFLNRYRGGATYYSGVHLNLLWMKIILFLYNFYKIKNIFTYIFTIKNIFSRVNWAARFFSKSLTLLRDATMIHMHVLYNNDTVCIHILYRYIFCTTEAVIRFFLCGRFQACKVKWIEPRTPPYLHTDPAEPLSQLKDSFTWFDIVHFTPSQHDFFRQASHH